MSFIDFCPAASSFFNKILLMVAALTYLPSFHVILAELLTCHKTVPSPVLTLFQPLFLIFIAKPAETDEGSEDALPSALSSESQAL